LIWLQGSDLESSEDRGGYDAAPRGMKLTNEASPTTKWTALSMKRLKQHSGVSRACLDRIANTSDDVDEETDVRVINNDDSVVDRTTKMPEIPENPCMFSPQSECHRSAQYICKACPYLQACEQCLRKHHRKFLHPEYQVYAIANNSI